MTDTQSYASLQYSLVHIGFTVLLIKGNKMLLIKTYKLVP